MERIKGQLLRKKPYKVIGNAHNNSLKLSVNELAGLNAGDHVYQEKLDNGIILLIPENIYKED